MTVDKWDRRALCDDGACTGVIGSDGTCKTCGKPSADFGDLRKPGRVSSKADVVEDEDEDEDEDVTDAVEAPASPSMVAASATKVSTWNTRTLCPDGACVGVIGLDGRCKVCGTNAGADAKRDVVEDDEEELEDGGEDGEDGDSDDEIAQDGEDGDSDDEIAQDEEAGEDDDDDDDDEDEDDDGDVDDDEEEDDDNRKLCSDGACTGVIGDNGTCKVCGKAAA